MPATLLLLVVGACNRSPSGPKHIESSEYAAAIQRGLDFHNKGDFDKAVEEWRSPANHGDAIAQRDLASAYELGEGVGEDHAQAIMWYRKAADQGNAEAENALGDIYHDGDRGVAKDDGQAFAWYSKAANKGLAGAQAKLGAMYSDGEGVGKDEAQAIAWSRKAANQGNATGQYNLGVIYAKGQGVQQDYAAALAWFRKAADQGEAESQYNVGIMYVKGQGIDKDYGQGLAWLLKAAGKENAHAQDALGVMYASGMGVAQDRAQAMTWYRKAIDQGDTQAKANFDAMFTDGQGFFAVYARGGNQYELSDEPVSTCVHLKGYEPASWKVGLWTGRWFGKVKACWYKTHIEKQRAISGYGENGEPHFFTLPAYDAVIFCLPYVPKKGVGQPSCTQIDPEYFTALDSLPRRAF